MLLAVHIHISDGAVHLSIGDRGVVTLFQHNGQVVELVSAASSRQTGSQHGVNGGSAILQSGEGDLLRAIGSHSSGTDGTRWW